SRCGPLSTHGLDPGGGGVSSNVTMSAAVSMTQTVERESVPRKGHRCGVVSPARYRGAMPTPLSERAAAPETVHEPTHPEVTWRAATAADVETVLALYRAAGAVDHPYFVVPRHEVTGKFSSSTVGPARDTMMAITPSGDVVAAGSATLGAGRATEVQTFIAGTVHPTWRGR